MVFDLARHGARAPLRPELTEGFQVNSGMLTSSGMRQHYLIGRFLRKKYIEDMEFLSPQYNEDEVHVSSTHVPRTIQSARSHMIGLYPPDSSGNIIKGDISKSLPLLNLSDSYVDETRFSIPSKYEPIAVHNNEQKRDTVYSLGACPYLFKKVLSYQADPKNWERFDDYFRPKIYKRLSEFFNYPEEEIFYKKAYELADAIVSMEYEGLVSRQDFSDSEWISIKRLQLPWLVDSVTPLGNKIMVSKLLNPIIEFMLKKIGREYDGRQTTGFRGTEKYIYFSTHDTMISNFLRFFRPENVHPQWVEYASSFIFELWEAEKGGYYLKIFYNNQQLQLPG